MNFNSKNYFKNNHKRTIKLLKKIFGISNIPEAIKEEEKLRIRLELAFQKDIELIDWNLIKEDYNFHIMYVYAKYLTLRSIINSHLENKKMSVAIDNLEELKK